jgi:hypothetical protein
MKAAQQLLGADKDTDALDRLIHELAFSRAKYQVYRHKVYNGQLLYTLADTPFPLEFAETEWKRAGRINAPRSYENEVAIETKRKGFYITQVDMSYFYNAENRASAATH